MRKIIEEFAEIRFAAASLAFSTLLSLIPFLIVVLAVFQSIGGLEQFYPQVEGVLLSYLKEATGNTIAQLIQNMIGQVHARPLGATGILLLLLTSMGLFRNIDIAFHRIWKIKLHRTLFKRLGLYAVIFTLIHVVLALFVGFRSIEVVRLFSEGVRSHYLLSVWITGFLFLIYKLIPETKVSWTSAAISSVVSGVLLAIVQSSFLWIALQIFRRNKIYGSLISLPIFLFWLFIVWCVVLAGVSLCAWLQRRLGAKE